MSSKKSLTPKDLGIKFIERLPLLAPLTITYSQKYQNLPSTFWHNNTLVLPNVKQKVRKSDRISNLSREAIPKGAKFSFHLNPAHTENISWMHRHRAAGLHQMAHIATVVPKT